MSETWRDLGGGSTDPNTRPDCSWNCDGMGLDAYADIRTRGFVYCPAHPHGVAPLHRPAPRRRHLRSVRASR